MAYMTNAQKIARVKSLLGDDSVSDADIVVLLDQASDAIIEVLYPFDDVGENASLPPKYSSLQCDLAARYCARMGANGETVHNENGINRTWASPDDADLLRKVTPRAKAY